MADSGACARIVFFAWLVGYGTEDEYRRPAADSITLMQKPPKSYSAPPPPVHSAESFIDFAIVADRIILVSALLIAFHIARTRRVLLT